MKIDEWINIYGKRSSLRDKEYRRMEIFRFVYFGVCINIKECV
jgi:hypothetical protein